MSPRWSHRAQALPRQARVHVAPEAPRRPWNTFPVSVQTPHSRAFQRPRCCCLVCLCLPCWDPPLGAAHPGSPPSGFPAPGTTCLPLVPPAPPHVWPEPTGRPAASTPVLQASSRAWRAVPISRSSEASSWEHSPPDTAPLPGGCEGRLPGRQAGLRGGAQTWPARWAHGAHDTRPALTPAGAEPSLPKEEREGRGMPPGRVPGAGEVGSADRMVTRGLTAVGTFCLCPVAPADRGDGIGPAAEDGGPREREGECTPGRQPRAATPPTRGPDAGPLVFQELFSKQKGYLDEELDYRKQCLDQAHKVRAARPRGVWAETGKVSHGQHASQGPRGPRPAWVEPVPRRTGSLSDPASSEDALLPLWPPLAPGVQANEQRSSGYLN